MVLPANIDDFFRKFDRKGLRPGIFCSNHRLLSGTFYPPPSPNIVVSWSLNPPKIIDSAEFLTSSLETRLHCANACAGAGFKVGFHFDPVIYYKSWEKDYRKTVDRLFDSVKPKDIAWISIGTLRFHRVLKKTIENRFPQNSILDEELTLGFDGKLRYEISLRREIYRKMAGWIRKRAALREPIVYLCMEEDSSPESPSR